MAGVHAPPPLPLSEVLLKKREPFSVKDPSEYRPPPPFAVLLTNDPPEIVSV